MERYYFFFLYIYLFFFSFFPLYIFPVCQIVKSVVVVVLSPPRRRPPRRYPADERVRVSGRAHGNVYLIVNISLYYILYTHFYILITYIIYTVYTYSRVMDCTKRSIAISYFILSINILYCRKIKIMHEIMDVAMD